MPKKCITLHRSSSGDRCCLTNISEHLRAYKISFQIFIPFLHMALPTPLCAAGRHPMGVHDFHQWLKKSFRQTFPTFGSLELFKMASCVQWIGDAVETWGYGYLTFCVALLRGLCYLVCNTTETSRGVTSVGKWHLTAIAEEVILSNRLSA